MIVKVGCCGFPGGMKRYFERFKLVEVQSTFYRLPKLETARRWREQAPAEFAFTVKAWQAITHPPTSPTWRRAGIQVPKEHFDKYGLLRPTEQVFEAWAKTKEICDALKAEVCLIQCPAAFGCTPENVENLRAFIEGIDRGDLIIAWEPRGDWKEPANRDLIRRLCEDLDLVHVVDILRYDPVITGDVVYTRLHGLNPDEYDYRYRYTDEDLRRLLEKVRALEGQGVETVYVLFNNVYMGDDAPRFAELLRR